MIIAYVFSVVDIGACSLTERPGVNVGTAIRQTHYDVGWIPKLIDPSQVETLLLPWPNCDLKRREGGREGGREEREMKGLSEHLQMHNGAAKVTVHRMNIGQLSQI